MKPELEFEWTDRLCPKKECKDGKLIKDYIQKRTHCSKCDFEKKWEKASKQWEKWDNLHRLSVTIVYRYKGGATNKVTSKQQAFMLNKQKGDQIGRTVKITYRIVDDDQEIDYMKFIECLHEEGLGNVGQFSIDKDPKLVRQVELDFVKRWLSKTPNAYDLHYVLKDTYKRMLEGEFDI